MKKKLALILALVLAFGIVITINALAQTITPGAPSELTATVHVGSITLVWKINSDSETSFEIERREGDGAWEPLASVAAGVMVYRDDTVVSGHTYIYRVRASNASAFPIAYSGYSNEASGTIATLAAPSGLTATAGPGRIVLSWTDNSDNEECFWISKRWPAGYGSPEHGMFYDSIDYRVSANTTTYADYDVEPGTEYTYKVRAYIGGPAETGIPDLSSAWSDEVTASVPEAVSASIEYFTEVGEYTPGYFADVNPSAWYGGVVGQVFSYGLMRGSGASAFNPLGNISLAEAITIATRVHCIYTNGVDDFPPVAQGEPWYKSNLEYAIGNGMITAADFASGSSTPVYSRAATRAEMAYVFSRALPESEFPQINTVNALPDVSNTTAYSPAILMLYRAGVLAGGDAVGTFTPYRNISRAEAAAIIIRVILPGERSAGRAFG